MKNIYKKFGITVGILIAVIFCTQTVSAAGTTTFNTGPSDSPMVLVSNYTKNPNCSSCWSTSVTADPGDIIAVEIYYHNTGANTATSTHVSGTPTSTTGKSGSFTITGTVTASNASTVSGSASVSINGTESLTPIESLWYPNGGTTFANWSYGQNGEETFTSNGILVGDIAPGWASQGNVVTRYQVSKTTIIPPTTKYTCNDGIDNDGDGYVDMADAGCSSSSDNDEYNYVAPTTYSCNDGRDNDGDGLIDMQDPGCTSSSDNDEYNYIQNQNTVSVTTQPSTNISQSNATLNGYVSASNNSSYTNAYFQYGTNPGLLSYTSQSSSVYGSANFSQTLYNLNSGVIYYFRAVATDTSGNLVYGQVLNFSTNQQYIPTPIPNPVGNSPIVASTVVNNITQTSAQAHGIVSWDNITPTTGWFEYGTSYSLGRTTTALAINLTSPAVFTDTLTGLSANTTYYVRAVAQNSYGISRGNIVSFRTLSNSVPTTPVVIVRTVTQTTGVGIANPLIDLQITSRQQNVGLNDSLEYTITWRSLTNQPLHNLILQVNFPKDIAYRGSSAGIYSPNENTLTLQIGTLEPKASGTIFMQATVSPSAKDRELLVTTATIAYTTPSNVQGNVVAYALHNVFLNGNNLLGASAFFGVNFLPTTLLGWLLLLLIILAIIVLTRREAQKRKMRQVEHTDTTTTTHY